MQIPSSFYFSRVFLSLFVLIHIVIPSPSHSVFLILLPVSVGFPLGFGYILLPLAAHLFAFVLLPLRHVRPLCPASCSPSSLLCIAHFYVFTFLLKRRTEGWKNSAHRKNRNEIFIIRQSKVFLSAFLACCFWGAVKNSNDMPAASKGIGNGKVGRLGGRGRWQLSSQSKYAKKFSAFEYAQSVAIWLDLSYSSLYPLSLPTTVFV